MEKLINEILSDNEIKEFIQKNNLSQNDILTFYPAFSLKKETNDVCVKCLGNGKCENKSEFCKCVLEYKNNRVVAKYVPCKYEKQGSLQTYFYEETEENVHVNLPRALILKGLNDFEKVYLEEGYAKGIYIHGGYGHGKSFILYNFAKKLVKNGKKVIYAYYPDLVRQIKSSIGTNQLEKLLLELKKVDVLMLDDLGGENNTSFTRDEVLGAILQYRMSQNLPVFATSNYSFEELTKHFADTATENDKLKAGRIMQRITYLMTPYELKDKDYRSE